MERDTEASGASRASRTSRTRRAGPFRNPRPSAAAHRQEPKPLRPSQAGGVFIFNRQKKRNLKMKDPEKRRVGSARSSLHASGHTAWRRHTAWRIGLAPLTAASLNPPNGTASWVAACRLPRGSVRWSTPYRKGACQGGTTSPCA